MLPSWSIENLENSWRRRVWTAAIFFVVAGFVSVFIAGMASSATSLDPNHTNNVISTNACIERGGVPLFTTYSRDSEEAMMVDCRIPVVIPYGR